jgi:hypothetical protein
MPMNNSPLILAAFFATGMVAMRLVTPEAPTRETIREVPTVVREFVREPCAADVARLYAGKPSPTTNERAARRLERDADGASYWAHSPQRAPLIDPRDVLIRQRIGK